LSVQAKQRYEQLLCVSWSLGVYTGDPTRRWSVVNGREEFPEFLLNLTVTVAVRYTSCDTVYYNFFLDFGYFKSSKHKGKIVPLLNQAPRREGVLGIGVITPCILNLGTRWT
jgi:hypothetical protein